MKRTQKRGDHKNVTTSPPPHHYLHHQPLLHHHRQMDLTLVSGAWPPHPPHPPSPHATLFVVPGMRQTAAIARNVVRNVRQIGKQPFSCVAFLYQPAARSMPRDNSTSEVEQVCTVMRWVGRNIIDYLKLLDADVTRGFGGGVL